MREVDIHPGGIELLLNGGPRASAGLDDLSIGCQDRQQSERNHLIGVHVLLDSLQKKDYRSVRKKETAAWSSGGLLLTSCVAEIQAVSMGFICIGYMPPSAPPCCLLAVFRELRTSEHLLLLIFWFAADTSEELLSGYV